MSFKLAVALILIGLVLVVLFQNAQVVTVRFLFWKIAMSRIILLLLTLIAGFVSGFVAAKLTGRR